MTKPVTSERLHWWPKSLSRFWADADGCVTQVSWNGDEVRRPPASFGIGTHTHNIRLKGPWASTFEPVFNKPDGQYPDLIEWMFQLDSKWQGEEANWGGRFLSQDLSSERRQHFSECLAALIVRSPNFRNRIRLTTEHYRQRFGMEDYQADKTLIAANLQGCYENFAHGIGRGGKFVVAFAESREFVFGDGFLHSFSSREFPIAPRCVVPLTPGAAVLFIKPMAFHPFPQLVTIRLSNEEVDFVNRTVQIYSRDHLFFRSHRPVLLKEFMDRQFYEFEYHKHERLEFFFDRVLQYRPSSLR